MAFDDRSLDDYITVPQRIAEFYKRYPEGSLQPQNIYEPYKTAELGDRVFIVYTALAFRGPDDQKPGVGCAWEPFPGRTPYTRDSELMNAETSAWGRAIVATGVTASRGIASREEAQNRLADRQQQEPAKTEPRQEARPAPAVGRPAAADHPDPKPPPDHKQVMAQELAIKAYELVTSGATVDDLKVKVYEPARSARILRTIVASPFSDEGERIQLSSVITFAKTKAGTGWPEGSVGEAAQK